MTKTTDRDDIVKRVESLTSEPPQEFSLRVERSKIAEFADALLDDNELFHDVDRARERGYESVPAPLTFVETSRFERLRKPPYEPDELFDSLTTLHASQEFEYERQPVAGETLQAVRSFEDYDLKEGEDGTLLFGVFRTEYRDEGNNLVLVVRKTVVVPGVDGS